MQFLPLQIQYSGARGNIRIYEIYSSSVPTTKPSTLDKLITVLLTTCENRSLIQQIGLVWPSIPSLCPEMNQGSVVARTGKP